jgi:RNA polymerase sigma-70 factor (ECF subfamily)
MGQPKLTFIEVYEKAFPAVWGYAAARGMIGADLEDVVQEVFVVVHQRLHTFEGRSSVNTWAVGIAVNVIRSFRRRRATRKLGDDLDQFPELEAARSTPSAQVGAKRDAEFLFAVLDGLSEPQREIFTLVEVQEVSASISPWRCTTCSTSAMIGCCSTSDINATHTS